MTANRDAADRRLAIATAGLARSRSPWGRAMRAELAALDDPAERESFSRSVAASAIRAGWLPRVALPFAAALATALVGLLASRSQLPAAGPGLLSVTVPVPALLMLGVALAAAAMTRSFSFGAEVGLSALLAGLVAVFAVTAFEGTIWMRERGVFILDGDPPRSPATDTAVVFDLFTTGMWVGHLIVWVPCLLIGAAVGGRLGAWQSGRRR
jgi:hypothetical protein